MKFSRSTLLQVYHLFCATVGLNQCHRRSGHLFQNRYKSILCEQDLYLKELPHVSISAF
jgi:hypothetical protein